MLTYRRPWQATTMSTASSAANPAARPAEAAAAIPGLEPL